MTQLFSRCKDWSPLQRRSARSASGVMGGLVAATMVPKSVLSADPSTFASWVYALLPILPLIGAVVVAWRYLSQETDEFVRTLVVRAMLCGLVLAVFVDVVAGSVLHTESYRWPWALMSADMFFAGSIVAFCLLRRSYR